jgi:predicted site-specific integrase-resolvase
MLRPLTKLIEILKEHGVENQTLAERLESWIIARDEIESDQLDELTNQVKQLKEKQSKLAKKKTDSESLVRGSRISTMESAKIALSEMFDAGMAVVTYEEAGTTYHHSISFGNQYAVECLVNNVQDIIYGEDEDAETTNNGGGTKTIDPDEEED